MQKSISRRKFLKTTAAGSAALALSATSYSRIIGANDRISIGIIGCGSRGIGAHMTGVHKPTSGSRRCQGKRMVRS